jgi:hypothetical protein
MYDTFKFMREEGVVMNISLLLNKIDIDEHIFLLKALLWLLEDFAGGGVEEVKTILEHNIVGRLISILTEMEKKFRTSDYA